MSDAQQYAALVEADCILTFELPDDVDDDDEDSIEAWLEDTVGTVDLGPVTVRGLQEDPMGEATDDA
jgi:hypothetical protein